MEENASFKKRLFTELKVLRMQVDTLRSEIAVNSPYMDKHEVAAFFRLGSVRSIERWMSKGLLVPIKKGSEGQARCLFLRTEVLAFNQSYFLRE